MSQFARSSGLRFYCDCSGSKHSSFSYLIDPGRRDACDARSRMVRLRRKELRMKRLIHRRRGGKVLCDLLVVAVLIPLLTVVFLACRQQRGDTSNRIKCASNLRQIGQAIQLYANENNHAYPRTRMDVASAHSPTWGTG